MAHIRWQPLTLTYNTFFVSPLPDIAVVIRLGVAVSPHPGRSVAVRAIRHPPAVVLKSGKAASARPARDTPVQRRDLLSLHGLSLHAAGTLFRFDACVSRPRDDHEIPHAPWPVGWRLGPHAIPGRQT